MENSQTAISAAWKKYLMERDQEDRAKISRYLANPVIGQKATGTD